MKIIQNSLIAFACFFMAACSKEGSVELGGSAGSGNSTGRAKTYTEQLIAQGDTAAYTYNLSYDNAGRLTTMALADNPAYRFVYAFPSATLLTGELFSGGTAPEVHVDYYLNAQSYFDSAFQYNDTKDSSSTKFIYNSSNQLITQHEYEYENGVPVLYQTLTYTYNSDGQVDKEVDSDGFESRYTYFTDARHPLPFVVGPLNERAKALWYVEQSRTMYQNGVLLGSAAHTYTFDNQGRILTDRAEMSDGTIAIKTYTY